jgi:hypothetical protein
MLMGSQPGIEFYRHMNNQGVRGGSAGCGETNRMQRSAGGDDEEAGHARRCR